MPKTETDLGPATIVAFENEISREALVRAVQAGRVRGQRDERGWLVSRRSATEFVRQRQESKADIGTRAGAA